MGLLDNLGLGDALKGALGQVEGAALPALINGVLAKTQYHDLNGLVAALQQGGLGPQDDVIRVRRMPDFHFCLSADLDALAWREDGVYLVRSCESYSSGQCSL